MTTIAFLEADDPRWPAALARLGHDVYHLPAYALIEARRIHAVAEAFLYEDGRRLFFLPYSIRRCELPDVYDVVSPYGYPGALLSAEACDPAFVRNAIDALGNAWIERGICSAFLRMHPIQGEQDAEVFPDDFFYDAHPTVAIDLSAEREVDEQLVKGHRRTIAKCAKSGFTARFAPLGEVLEPLIAIYTQTMDRVKARSSYYFDRDYFTALAGMPEVRCGIVELENEAATACVFFESQGIVQAHLGGTADRFYQQSPFHFLLNQAAHWAKSRGNRWLHLGGGVGGENDALLSFKAGFSEQRFQFRTARLVLDPVKYRQLLEIKSASDCTPIDDLLASGYFPAYRCGG